MNVSLLVIAAKAGVIPAKGMTDARSAVLFCQLQQNNRHLDSRLRGNDSLRGRA